MYSNLAFSITTLGIFSILELLKANQRFSHLKYQMLFLLVWLTISSGLDYFDLIGYHIPFYLEVTKFIGTSKHPFDGKIGNLNIYNKVFSDFEIYQKYSTNKMRFGY